MSSTSSDPHASDATAGPHGTGDHGDGHGHDDHAHRDGEALGGVDFTIWLIGAVGIFAGLLVAAALAMSTGRFG